MPGWLYAVGLPVLWGLGRLHSAWLSGMESRCPCCSNPAPPTLPRHPAHALLVSYQTDAAAAPAGTGAGQASVGKLVWPL